MATCAIAHRTFWELEAEVQQLGMRRSNSDFCLRYEGMLEPAGDNTPRSQGAESECSFQAASSTASTVASQEKRRAVRVAECLDQLDFYDAECILRVTRLVRAGKDAIDQLSTYMQSFGPIERLLEVHPQRLNRNEKISNMVYVVMKDSEAAKRILNMGNDHQLPGGTVLVRDFQRKRHC